MMEVGNLKENNITKNLLLDKTCHNCFFHTNRDKPLALFCMKEIEADYDTCEEWESSKFNEYIVFQGLTFTKQSDVEFAEKEIEKLKNKHNL